MRLVILKIADLEQRRCLKPWSGPLERGLALLEGARRLLLDAASSVIAPESQGSAFRAACD